MIKKIITFSLFVCLLTFCCFCGNRKIYIKEYYADKNSDNCIHNDDSNGGNFTEESGEQGTGDSPKDNTKPSDDDNIIDDAIRVAFTDNWQPYSYKDEEGNIKGFDVEVISAILDEMGINYEIVTMNWSKAITSLKVGVIHLLPYMSITEERKLIYNFTDSYAKSEDAIFISEDGNPVKGSTKEEIIKNLSGMRVSVHPESPIYDSLRKNESIIIITERDGIASLRNLGSGKVDAVPMDKLSGLYQKKLLNLPIKISTTMRKSPYYTGVYKGMDETFIENFNKALERIKQNVTFDKIYNKWF